MGTSSSNHLTQLKACSSKFTRREQLSVSVTVALKKFRLGYGLRNATIIDVVSFFAR